MTKTKFRTNFNNVGEPIKRKKFTMPSMTVPDQSMTVQEIQIRFAAGIPISQTKVPVYNGEEDFWHGIDPKSLDIVELNEIIANRIQEAKDNKTRVEKEVAERQAEAARLKSEREAKEIATEVERREKEIDRLMGQRTRTRQLRTDEL